jgi:hypothetical protein
MTSSFGACSLTRVFSWQPPRTSLPKIQTYISMRSSLVTDHALTRSPSYFAHETYVNNRVCDWQAWWQYHTQFCVSICTSYGSSWISGAWKVTNVIILGNRRTHVLVVQLCILLNSVVFNMWTSPWLEIRKVKLAGLAQLTIINIFFESEILENYRSS